MPIEPPDGFDDMQGDAEMADAPPSRYASVEVEDVGPVRARRPLPNAVPALAMAVNSKIDNTARANYQMLFVRNHLDEGEVERILVGMVVGDYPDDAFSKISEAVATWGTSRPT